MDCVVKVVKPNPFRTANILSKLVFGWMIKFCYNNLKKCLKVNDLYECLPEFSSRDLADKLDMEWNKELEKAKINSKQPKLYLAIIRTFWIKYLKITLVVFVVLNILRPLLPILLSMLIKEFSIKSEFDLKEKLMLGSLLILVTISVCYSTQHFTFRSSIIGTQIRISCCSLVYRKLLKLSTISLNKTAPGQLINLLTNDVQRFDYVVLLSHFVWIMPFQVVLLTYLIWREVGLSSLISVSVILILTVPIQGLIAKLGAIFRLKIATNSDIRIKLIGQLIAGIQVVKMYGWEDALADTVKKVRNYEIKLLKVISFMRAILVAMSVYVERLITYFTIISYVLLGNNIVAEKVFSLALFSNILQLTVAIYFPLGLMFLSETKVSLERIQEFLLLDEKEKPKLQLKNDGNVTFKNVDAFLDLKIPFLNDLSFHIPKGSLCVIIGPVGSGKSTLLKILLGEIADIKGTVEVGGSVSYSSQDPWIFSSTVRKNIVFGQQYNKSRYGQIVEVCALKTDFKQFPYNDKTIIGDKGVSISGGQRARINLARTIYRDADIYLLDDPLSAVDAHVGKHLFQKCILDYLKNKTRILVTHQLQHLQDADQIIVLGTNGRIEALGSYDELLKSNFNLTKFLSLDDDDDDVERTRAFERNMAYASIKSVVSDDWESKQLDQYAENTVNLAKSPYIQLAKEAMNFWRTVFFVFSLIISQTATSGCDFWISYWSRTEEKRLNSPNNEHYLSTEMFMIIYTIFILSTIFLVIFRSFLFNVYVMIASNNLHGRFFEALLRAPMRFFHINPLGRILQRFSKDVGIIDEILPRNMLNAITVLLLLCGIFVNISISNPWLFIGVFITATLYLFLLRYFVTIAKKLRHLEGITRSPIFSHINATFNGLLMIRSTNNEKILEKEFDEHQDTHTSAWFLTIANFSAFGLWLDTISCCFVACITFIFTFISEKGVVSPSTVGLAIQQSLSLVGSLSYGMRQLTETVSSMTAVERILEYVHLKKEEDATVNKIIPDNTWPSKGAISFQNLYLRYSQDDPPVLKNLCLTIEAGEKIGIVGRTGAGKTSLIGALFRLAFIDGKIIIDGINICEIPVKELRKRISIIPQEPLIFNESIRYNLDPFNEFDDEKLWSVLDDVKLKEIIPSLDMLLQEGGGNLSVGQRQLVCLARVILKDRKILILDEATANVDPKTDALIQTTIRIRFKHYTVLTVAHRLNTVMDSDKILVMDGGFLAEFDHPYKLLQNPDGVFYKLVSQTGQSMSNQLHEVAEHKYNERKNVISTRL